MTNDISIGSMNRHKLIDCREFVSKSMAKKAATTMAKISIQRPNSILNEISDESNSLTKQSRLRSLLAKDFHE
jgi:hypothetical protein